MNIHQKTKKEIRRNTSHLKIADKDLSRTRQYSGRLSLEDTYEEKVSERFERLTIRMYNDPNQITYVPDKFKVPRGLPQQKMTIRIQTDPGQSLPNDIKELEEH